MFYFGLCGKLAPSVPEGGDFASFAVNGLELEYYDPLLSVFEDSEKRRTTDSEKDSEEDYEAIVICAIEIQNEFLVDSVWYTNYKTL
ncbi:unnamed protein product [Caenorhabditis nigoni]